MTAKSEPVVPAKKGAQRYLMAPMSFENLTARILKDSDRRCGSKEFQTLNLIASFVSFTEGGVGIEGEYTDSWRKDTNLKKGMLNVLLMWHLVHV